MWENLRGCDFFSFREDSVLLSAEIAETRLRLQRMIHELLLPRRGQHRRRSWGGTTSERGCCRQRGWMHPYASLRSVADPGEPSGRCWPRCTRSASISTRYQGHYG